MRERERAERCFALARSTTFPAERETAINRGKAIANAAGLDLAEFDIPGESRPKPPPSRFRSDFFERPRSPFYSGEWSREDLDDVLKRYWEQMEAAERQARDSDLARVVREKQRRAAELLKLKDALNHLWSRGVRIYPTLGGEVTTASMFIAPDESGLEYTDEGVFELARARGWNR